MIEESPVPAAEKTLRIIELLLDHQEGLSPQELLLHLDISRSTLFLFLRTLKNLGYIEQTEKRGRYRSGPRLEAWRPSQTIPATQDLLAAFYQEAGHQSFKETIALTMESGSEVLVLAQVEGANQVRSVFTPGQVYSNLEAVHQVLSPAPAQIVKENGFSLISQGESMDLALPICRDGYHAEAALMISAPAYRWTEAKLLDAMLADMRAMAARLSYHLGAVTYAPYRGEADLLRQPTTPLTAEEIGDFLQGPWTARLACVRPDGHPHVIPVWQEWDQKHFYVIAWEGSQWADYVLQNRNVSLTVDEPWPPLRRLVVRGYAEPLSPVDSSVDLDALI